MRIKKKNSQTLCNQIKMCVLAIQRNKIDFMEQKQNETKMGRQ